MESWSKLGFQPDLAIGKFGIGLDLTFRFKLYPNASTPFEIYTPDWIPQAGKTVFDIYLPKIMYVRYGLRGVDPLYIKLGSISDFTLGNGLIISNYTNTLFLPDLRIFGMQFGIDGSLFNFPYIGMEALTGNLAKLDVMGGRVYVRPLAFLGGSLFGRMQIGGTVVADTNPLLYTSPAGLISEPIYVLGADVTLPIVQGSLFSLTTFVEGAREMNNSVGAATGVGGRLVGFVNYGAQLRYFQTGFIPSYFDANYDLYRVQRFQFVKNAAPGSFVPGWLASLGFSILKDKIEFNTSLDGPFAAIPAVPTDNSSAYPHLKAIFSFKEGIISGISMDAGYEKFFIGKNSPFFPDLIDPTNAGIGMAFHYRTGAAVLTLNYSYRYDPTAKNWNVSSSLTTSVRF
jgi:hypothetical protein